MIDYSKEKNFEKIRLPHPDGFLCRQLRRWYREPIHFQGIT